MSPNPDYIPSEQTEALFQWGDGNFIASFDPALEKDDKSTTARYRFEDGKWVLEGVIENPKLQTSKQ